MDTEGNWNGTRSPSEGERVEEHARGAAGEARSQLRSIAESGREELAEQIDHIGHALRTAGERLRDEEQGQAGHYSELLGERVERVATYLRDHDANDLLGQVERFARERPLVFLGGCALAGVALGRFLKASPTGQERMPLGVSGEESRYEPRETEALPHAAIVRAPEPQGSEAAGPTPPHAPPSAAPATVPGASGDAEER